MEWRRDGAERRDTGLAGGGGRQGLAALPLEPREALMQASFVPPQVGVLVRSSLTLPLLRCSSLSSVAIHLPCSL